MLLTVLCDLKWFWFILFYFYSVTMVCIFSPSLHPTPASTTSLPHLYPPPWFCPCVLYSNSYRPLSPLSPPHSPLAIVTMFLISMSLVIFCLLFSFFFLTWMFLTPKTMLANSRSLINTCWINEWLNL